MDSYVALHHVDGYRISLTKEVVDNQGLSLYFVNFGGYFRVVWRSFTILL